MTVRFGTKTAKQPEVIEVRPLTEEEITAFQPSSDNSRVQKFRDSHHMVARLFAMGLRPGEVAERAGYSLARVSTLYADPSFQNLIVEYRQDVDGAFRENVDEYFELINRNRILSARLLHDKLTDAEPEDLTVTQLVSIHSDAADRTGYPKRTIAVNVNVDFAAKLDRARERSQQVKLLPSPEATPPAQGMGTVPAEVEVPSSIPMASRGPLVRRRA